MGKLVWEIWRNRNQLCWIVDTTPDVPFAILTKTILSVWIAHVNANYRIRQVLRHATNGLKCYFVDFDNWIAIKSMPLVMSSMCSICSSVINDDSGNEWHPKPDRFHLLALIIKTILSGTGTDPELIHTTGTFHTLGLSCGYFQALLSFPGLSWPQSEGSWLSSMLHKGPGHSSCLPLIQCVNLR